MLDQGLAAWESIIHGLAFGLGEHGWVAALAAGHWTVVLVLDESISQAIADQDGLQVDVTLLVGQDLGGENWDVVASIRLSSNMEVLLRVLWKLLEEERQESVDVLAGCNGVGDGGAGVGVSDVDGLIEEDNGGVGVPRVGIGVELQLLVNG